MIKDVEEQVAALKLSGKLPLGLVEQYDIQLAALRNPEIRDCKMNVTLDVHTILFKSNRVY